MRKELIDNNPVIRLSIEVSLLAIAYCEQLTEERKFVVANQLLKSATSIGANVMEAQNPESKSDFIHKMKIAGKEADETQYWLILCTYAPSYPGCTALQNKLDEVSRVLNAILSTAERKNPFSYLLSMLL